jgi:hypothetical protein
MLDVHNEMSVVYRRFASGPIRGENPELVVNEIRAAADIVAGESAIGKRQSVLFGLASVTTDDDRQH